MATELIACPRCGASPSGPADAFGQHVCVYCGSRYQTTQATAVRPALVSPHAHVLPPVQPAQTKGTGAGGILAAVGGVFALLLAAGAVVAWLSPSKRGTSTSVPSPLLGTANNGGIALSPAAATPDVPASAKFKLESTAPGYKSSFYLLGFVTNTSPYPIDKPKLTAVLLSGSGKELATRDGFANCDALAPNETAPVKLLVSDPPTHERIEIEVVAKKATYIPERASDLRLEILEQPHVTAFGSSWETTGKVHNDGKRGARFVKVDVLAFDEQNKLVGLDYTYVDGERLAAGASGRFRAMPLYKSSPHHFKLEVSGRLDQ